MFWRVCYSLLGALLLPLLLVRLWWRGRKNPGYRKNIGERFGRYTTPSLRNVIWIHAVSVGETRAAAPLIALLEQHYPDTPIVLTHMTATGRATGEALFGKRVTQLWLPYDYRFAVRAFLDHVQPKWTLLMETEVWPNVIAECARRQLPCFLVNARMSEHSAARYARFASFTRPLFAALTGVAAQTESDAQRFRQLGARDVTVTGNLKFDIGVPENARALGETLSQRFCPKPDQRPIWIAASTRDGEEALLLDALSRQPDALPPRTLTVIVPRHPERFEVVAEQLRARKLAFVKRSDERDVPPEVAFVLGDSMGEMFAYYLAADLAFVGGSLLPFGGQNLLEPLAAGTPALIGAHTFNFKEISNAACAVGAVTRVNDADELIAQVGALLRNDEARQTMRDAGLRFLEEHRGAAERLAQWLEKFV